MSDIAIRVEGLGKKYRLGANAQPYKTLRDSLTGVATTPLRVASRIARRAPGDGQRGHRPEFWAVKDVGFDVKHGEVLGIIGRNGAGKSTLLKLLSQITEPTEGRIGINGRVASLLEVGTGFHPELSGRENIYLNGAILGMARTEIERKFDEIVAFAEVEKFIDTQVKHYSSGMYLRLAFAVAAHLEPEILIVDEVLSVGDTAFQKKCIGKMSDVAGEGRTVLLVSHNMAAVESLCAQAIWLQAGTVAERGHVSNIVSSYLKTSSLKTSEQTWPDIPTAPGNELVRIHRAAIRVEADSATDSITVQSPLALEFDYWNLQPNAFLNLSLVIYNEDGVVVFNTVPLHEPRWNGRPFPIGLFRSVCHIPANLLNNGLHRVELLVVRNAGHVIYKHDDILVFDVLDDIETRGDWHGKWIGALRPSLSWTTDLIEAQTAIVS